MPAQFGLIGLAVMGENLALNLADHGVEVAVYNRTPERTRRFVEGAAAGRSIQPTYSLAELVARLERALAEHDKTHLFVEIADFHGFDWTSLGEYLPHSWRMLVEREKFGRIAVVSDIAWIRWATRLESALIPGLSYETYRMDEREQALAWVEGRSPYPHGEAVTWLETGDPEVFGFELDGRVDAVPALGPDPEPEVQELLRPRVHDASRAPRLPRKQSRRAGAKREGRSHGDQPGCRAAASPARSIATPWATSRATGEPVGSTGA